MSYELNAVIGRQAGLQAHVARYGHARAVPLTQGLALIPVTDELWDELAAAGPAGEVDPYPEFDYLSPTLAAWAREISTATAVAYVESELWAGTGAEAAIVWEEGAVVLAPRRLAHPLDPAAGGTAPLRGHPLNQALRSLGATCGPSRDEFEAVGLGCHRHTDDWR